MLSWFKSLWISPWTVTFGLPQQFLHNFYHFNYRAVRTVGGCPCAVSIWCSIACRGNRGGRGVIPCTACQCLHTCAWARTPCLKQEHRKTKLTPINTNIAENTKMLLCGGLKNKLPGTFLKPQHQRVKIPYFISSAFSFPPNPSSLHCQSTELVWHRHPIFAYVLLKTKVQSIQRTVIFLNFL